MLYLAAGALYRRTAKQRSWRLICGKVMVYSRQRYGLSHAAASLPPFSAMKRGADPAPCLVHGLEVAPSAPNLIMLQYLSPLILRLKNQLHHFAHGAFSTHRFRNIMRLALHF